MRVGIVFFEREGGFHQAGSLRDLPGFREYHHLGRRLAIESFYVEDVDGPLVEGELDRARELARTVSASVTRPEDHS